MNLRVDEFLVECTPIDYPLKVEFVEVLKIKQLGYLSIDYHCN